MEIHDCIASEYSKTSSTLMYIRAFFPRAHVGVDTSWRLPSQFTSEDSFIFRVSVRFCTETQSQITNYMLNRVKSSIRRSSEVTSEVTCWGHKKSSDCKICWRIFSESFFKHHFTVFSTILNLNHFTNSMSCFPHKACQNRTVSTAFKSLNTILSMHKREFFTCRHNWADVSRRFWLSMRVRRVHHIWRPSFWTDVRTTWIQYQSEEHRDIMTLPRASSNLTAVDAYFTLEQFWWRMPPTFRGSSRRSNPSPFEHGRLW